MFVGQTNGSLKSNVVLFLAAGVSILFHRALAMVWWASRDGWKQSNYKEKIKQVPDVENVSHRGKEVNGEVISPGLREEWLRNCCKVIVLLLCPPGCHLRQQAHNGTTINITVIELESNNNITDNTFLVLALYSCAITSKSFLQMYIIMSDGEHNS